MSLPPFSDEHYKFMKENGIANTFRDRTPPAEHSMFLWWLHNIAQHGLKFRAKVLPNEQGQVITLDGDPYGHKNTWICILSDGRRLRIQTYDIYKAWRFDNEMLHIGITIDGRII